MVTSLVDSMLGLQLKARVATFCEFRAVSGDTLDSGIALFFPGPHSYTGEDVLELHGHGGRIVQQMIVEEALNLGARLANPGEFTQRAFLNGRMDLAEAEAVADLINSTSRLAARAAAKSLTGEFSKVVKTLDREVLDLRVFIEGAIDFPEDEIDFIGESEVQAQLECIRQNVADLLLKSEQGEVMLRGTTVVIAGEPNVGKSSLLNALVGEDRAIVTDIPGTTRDTLDVDLVLDGLPITFIDTAGLRMSDDIVEKAGVQRTREALHNASGTLWMVDDASPDKEPDEAVNEPILKVRNKCDLTEREPGIVCESTYRISAKKRWGLDELQEGIKTMVGFQEGEDAFAGRPRHINALKRTNTLLAQAEEELVANSPEVVADLLRETHTALGEIVGETTTDELLGSIFSRFCIGK